MSGIQFKFTNGIETPLYCTKSVEKLGASPGAITEVFDHQIAVKSIGLLIGHTFIYGIRLKDENENVFFETKWAIEGKYIRWCDQQIP